MPRVAAALLVNPRTVTVTGSPLMAVPSGSRLPARGATGVPVDALLRIGFDAAPGLGATGTVSNPPGVGRLDRRHDPHR